MLTELIVILSIIVVMLGFVIVCELKTYFIWRKILKEWKKKDWYKNLIRKNNYE